MSQDVQIRDPVHGFISLEGRELDLLGTRLMQRLRNISQLALAKHVYPGAGHSRFDHTLGVLHVSNRMCQVLGVDADHRRIIRLAALLHDSGHGPFSHVSESVLETLAPPTLVASAGRRDKIHEAITQKIILSHGELDDALSRRDRQEIASLLHSGLDDRLYRSIISGPLDADKQDYLLRDSLYCGVRYGVYDIDQLQGTLQCIRDGSSQEMMVSEAGVHTLEQFVLAKYYLTTQVYRHKVRLITDGMLVRALRLGVEMDGISCLKDLYVYNDTDDFIRNYLTWDDQRLTVELLRDEYQNTHAGEIFRRLADRRLFKRVYSRSFSELDGKLRVALPQRLPEVQAVLEREIAVRLSEMQPKPVSPEHVILQTYEVDSVRKQSRNSEGSILIVKPGGYRKFETVSTLFKSIDEKLKEEFVECYADVTFKDERDKRDQLEQINAFVTTLLESITIMGK